MFIIYVEKEILQNRYININYPVLQNKIILQQLITK